jgi:hypothetical protein
VNGRGRNCCEQLVFGVQRLRVNDTQTAGIDRIADLGNGLLERLGVELDHGAARSNNESSAVRQPERV